MGHKMSRIVARKWQELADVRWKWQILRVIGRCREALPCVRGHRQVVEVIDWQAVATTAQSHQRCLQHSSYSCLHSSSPRSSRYHKLKH